MLSVRIIIYENTVVFFTVNENTRYIIKLLRGKNIHKDTYITLNEIEKSLSYSLGKIAQALNEERTAQ